MIFISRPFVQLPQLLERESTFGYVVLLNLYTLNPLPLKIIYPHAHSWIVQKINHCTELTFSYSFIELILLANNFKTLKKHKHLKQMRHFAS